MKALHLSNSLITLAESSILDGNGLTITANHSSLIAGSSPVLLQWQAVNFPGEVRIGTSSLMAVEGDNRMGKIYGQGKIVLNGSNRIDTLTLEAGAEMELGTATVQTLSSQTQLLGNSQQPVTVLSTGQCTLFFSDHAKLCFDFLNVNNVEVKGKAIVNAGLQSVLFNAGNWQEKECTDVLFADFDVQYNCTKASTEFSDRSSGNVLNYSWHFGNSLEDVHEANPTWKFDNPGKYKVLLTVTNGDKLDSVSKNIVIIPNPMLSNQIISKLGIFTSFYVFPRYQWYKDGIALAGATNRSYAWAGTEGVYYVVSYQGQCNIISDTVTIAGLRDEGKGIEVYPNPASDYLMLRLPDPMGGKVILTDFLGIPYLEHPIDQPETLLSLQRIPAGVYVLQILLPGRRDRRKIVIVH